ncbi:MAG: HAD-IIIA family hydrolase [Bacteroidota bacterium]|nr:HAD-IIIA family hydrolase [Bacteroidota bacterium]
MEERSIREKASLIRMLILDVDGTMTDGGVYIDTNGIQSKKFNIKDGMGITQLIEKGIDVAIISHSRSQTILDERARMLGIKYVYSGKESKLKVMHRWILDMKLSQDQIAYMGDDVNDIEIMQEVGLSACPADAHSSVVRIADVVLQKKGGEGCVREFIDRYLLADNA